MIPQMTDPLGRHWRQPVDIRQGALVADELLAAADAGEVQTAPFHLTERQAAIICEGLKMVQANPASADERVTAERLAHYLSQPHAHTPVAASGGDSCAKPRPSDDHLWDETLRDRDAYHEWADKLADAIATHFGADVGEHSNMNCPWAEALEVIEGAHPAPVSTAAAPELAVKLAEMRESNGNVTWDVLLVKAGDSLMNGHSVYTDRIKGRAEYEADSLRHFLGQGPYPDILAYDTDPPVAEVSTAAAPTCKPAQAAPEAPTCTGCDPAEGFCRACREAERNAAPEAPAADPDGDFAKGMLIQLARMGATPAGLSLAVQLFGVGPCEKCGYRKLHCRCAAPEAPATEQQTPADIDHHEWASVHRALVQARDYLQKDGSRHSWLDGDIAMAAERSRVPAATTASASEPDLLSALKKAARLLKAAGFAMTGTATSQIVAAIDAADSCAVPPPGWQCTRPAGHEGPCAAIQATSNDSSRAADEQQGAAAATARTVVGLGATVYVCPERDIECGSRATNWCATCPKRCTQADGQQGASRAALDLSGLPLYYMEGIENGGYYLATDVTRLDTLAHAPGRAADGQQGASRAALDVEALAKEAMEAFAEKWIANDPAGACDALAKIISTRIAAIARAPLPAQEREQAVDDAQGYSVGDEMDATQRLEQHVNNLWTNGDVDHGAAQSRAQSDTTGGSDD